MANFGNWQWPEWQNCKMRVTGIVQNNLGGVKDWCLSNWTWQSSFRCMKTQISHVQASDRVRNNKMWNESDRNGLKCSWGCQTRVPYHIGLGSQHSRLWRHRYLIYRLPTGKGMVKMWNESERNGSKCTWGCQRQFLNGFDRINRFNEVYGFNEVNGLWKTWFIGFRNDPKCFLVCQRRVPIILDFAVNNMGNEGTKIPYIGIRQWPEWLKCKTKVIGMVQNDLGGVKDGCLSMGLMRFMG